MAGLRTEYPFVLPKGVIGPDGRVHREGTMRLATARDELEPVSSNEVTGADDPALAIAVLARVVTRLGEQTTIGTDDIEGLFAADLAHLQDVYGIINYGTEAEVQQLLAGQRAAVAVAADPGPPDPGPPDPGPPGRAVPPLAAVTDPVPDANDDDGDQAGDGEAIRVDAADLPSDGRDGDPDGDPPVQADPEPAPESDLEPEPASEVVAMPTPSLRRARIEEVGRSVGRPGGR